MESQDSVNGETLTDGIITDEELEAIIRAYEEKYGMISEEFLAKYRAFEFPDTFDAMAWSMLLKSR